MKLERLLKYLIAAAVLAVVFGGAFIYRYQSTVGHDGRLINYGGMVRGMSQRVVKLEFAQRPEISDGLMKELDQILHGLRYGDESFRLTAATDPELIRLLEEITWRWNALKERLLEARDNPLVRDDLLRESEQYFALTNTMVWEMERISMEKHYRVERFVIGMAVLYISIIISGYFFIRLRIMHPFAKIREVLPKVAEGDFSQYVEINTRDEFGELAEMINAVTRKLAEYYGKLQGEIKTKTASLNTKIVELHQTNTELELKKVAMLNVLEDAQAAEKESLEKARQLSLANRKLSQEKARTEAILRFLQSIGEVVYATDTERKIIFVNEAGASLMGKSQDEVYGTTTSDHVTYEVGEGARAKRFFPVRTTLQLGVRTPFPPHTFCIRGEERIPISGAASPIYDEEKRLIGVIVSFMDDTQNFRLEKSKDRFLSVAAHQLRTPLGSMRWTIEFLEKEKFGKISKSAKEAVIQLAKNNERMLAIVNELLDIARFEEGSATEAPVKTDLIELIHSIATMLAPRATELKMPIRISAPKDGVPALMLNRGHIYEALENLVVNAFQYNRESEPIQIEITKTKSAVSVNISDHGIGIPEKDQSRIFTKFYRAKNAMRHFTDGTGLGLSLVKSYMEENGGTISFVSHENVGTTFTLTFPIPPEVKS